MTPIAEAVRRRRPGRPSAAHLRQRRGSIDAGGRRDGSTAARQLHRRLAGGGSRRSPGARAVHLPRRGASGRRPGEHAGRGGWRGHHGARPGGPGRGTPSRGGVSGGRSLRGGKPGVHRRPLVDLRRAPRSDRRGGIRIPRRSPGAAPRPAGQRARGRCRASAGGVAGRSGGRAPARGWGCPAGYAGGGDAGAGRGLRAWTSPKMLLRTAWGGGGCSSSRRPARHS